VSDRLTHKAIVYRFYSGCDLPTQQLRFHRSKSHSASRSYHAVWRSCSASAQQICTESLGPSQHPAATHVIYLTHDIESDDCEAYFWGFSSLVVRAGTMIPRNAITSTCFLENGTSTLKLDFLRIPIQLFSLFNGHRWVLIWCYRTILLSACFAKSLIMELLSITF
jgi:hypothetical protein